MDTEQLKTLCGRFPGASSKLYAPPSNVLIYSVGGKSFACFKTSEPDVPGIKPAGYMARFHWVTIVDGRRVSVAYLTELVEWSYRKALGSLSRKRQNELIG